MKIQASEIVSIEHVGSLEIDADLHSALQQVTPGRSLKMADESGRVWAVVDWETFEKIVRRAGGKITTP